MSRATSLALNNRLQPIIRVVTDARATHHAAHKARHLPTFSREAQGIGALVSTRQPCKATKRNCRQGGLAPASISQQLSAIRKLAGEAVDKGLMDSTIAMGIGHVEGVKSRGVRSGNWLTREQAQAMLNTPDIDNIRGLPNRALLAVMIGAGLRRSIAADLIFEHIQRRYERWVIGDLVGKGYRVRTVPIPPWTKKAVDEWARAGNLSGGRIFRPIHEGGFINSEGTTAQAVRDVVTEYAAQIGVDAATHGPRRTFVKLAHRDSSGLKQV